MNNFLHDQFDKMVLLFLIIVFLSVAVFAHGQVDYATRSVDTLTGALIGIITGKILAKKESGE